ncbi:MAG: two-component sensor histidine kinase [Rhizobiaceae bacterium]|nr:two-component sensor histidine kinase [Rhizobiaceae bacterium]
MAEARRSVKARRWAALAAGRLRRSAALLAASIAALLALHLASGGSARALAAAVAAVLLVALVSSGRRAPPPPAEPAQPLRGDTGGLTVENLAAAVADPLILGDARGAVLIANRAAVAAFGEMRPGLSLLLKFRAPEMQLLLETMISPKPEPASIDYVDRLPFERVFRVNAQPVGHATGMFVLLFKDQSEARRIERMRADFIANASHELRTPLAAISGFVETLRGPARNDAAARDRFLQIMQDQTARMARLIEDLLSLSRLEMKAPALAGKTVELSAVVDSVVETLRTLALDSGVEIDNLFGAAPIEIAGDRDELFQIFQNLVENACKYGRSGGRVQISRVIGAGRNEIGVEIRDFGPGIAAEHIPRITERFYRIDVESSRLQKGTGLGLSIVKHIVSRHKGRLAIASELGKGAAFTVYLPTS